MITAIIIAGGVGKRMGQDIPKQFINIEGSPSLFIHWSHSNTIHRLIEFLLYVNQVGKKPCGLISKSSISVKSNG